MSEATSALTLPNPDVSDLQRKYDETSHEIVDVSREEGDVLREIQSKLIKDPSKNAYYLLYKEVIDVYGELLEDIKGSVDTLKKNDEDVSKVSDGQIVTDGVTDVIGKLKSGEGKSGKNKATFERVATSLERFLTLTGDNQLALDWLPNKVFNLINTNLNDAKERISGTTEVTDLIKKFRDKVDRILTIAQTLDEKLEEVRMMGRDNVLQLAPLNAAVDFLRELRNKFNELTPDAEIDVEKIRAEVRQKYEPQKKKNKEANKKAAVSFFGKPIDQNAKMEQSKFSGEDQNIDLTIEKEITETIEKIKEENARKKGFPEELIKLQQQLEVVESKRNDLLLLVETQVAICKNIMAALKYLKREGANSAENREESIRHMVELMVRQEIEWDKAITFFNSVDDKGEVTGAGPDDTASLGEFFGVPPFDLMRIYDETIEQFKRQTSTVTSMNSSALTTQPKTSTKTPETDAPIDNPEETRPPEYGEALPPVPPAQAAEDVAGTEEFDLDNEEEDEEADQEHMEDVGEDDEDEESEDDDKDETDPKAPKA